ncbi:hypothetical protein [Nocardioides hungaricus]
MIERVEYDEDAQVLVAHMRPTNRQRGRAGPSSSHDGDDHESGQ